MKALIIEDERFATEKLIELLKTIDKDLEITGTLETVEESVNWLINNPKPDIIFMDIELDDGICFEIFESLNITTPIIFTTAYDEYAIRAFKVNSIDYLLKPIDIESLRKAIVKFKTIYDTAYMDSLQLLLKNLNKEFKSRFLVKIGNSFLSIPIDDIACFYIQNRSTFLRKYNRRNYAIDFSMEQLEKVIDPKLFFRINRNYIVNINAISHFYSYSSNSYQLKMIVQEQEDDLTISRSRLSNFKKWVDK